LQIEPTQLADEVMEAIGPLFKWRVEGVKDVAANASSALALAEGDATRISLDLVDDKTIAGLMQHGIQTGDERLVAFGQLLSNETGRKTLQSGVNRTLPAMLGLTKSEGGKAAKTMLEFNKLLSSQFWDMRSSAMAAGNESLGRVFTQVNDRVSSVFSKALDTISDGTFTKMNQNFAILKNGLELFDKAAKNYAVDKQAYSKLYNSMKGSTTLANYRRQMLASVDDLIAARMPHMARRISSITDKIDVNLAASHFAPWINPRSAALIPTLGLGTFLATEGNPNVAAGVAGTAVLTSPRLAAKVFGAAARASFQGANTGIAKQLATIPEVLKGMQVVKGLTSNLGRAAVHGTKAAITASALEQLVKGYTESGMQRMQTRDQLLQQGLGGGQ
jgi:hypothetical protein